MKNILLKLNSALILLTFLVSAGGVLGQTVTQTFNASGSWTVPCGVTSVTVQAWGGGGGGAGEGTDNGVSSAHGGGGGGYVTTSLIVAPGTVIPYTVGAGGTFGTGNGGNGGNTTFSTITANGGTGGTSAAVGIGGSGSGGTVTNGSNGSAPSGTTGGSGGNSGGPGGTGGSGGIDGVNGSPGNVPGGGGGGAGDRTGGAESGGGGGAGQITITYTIPSAGTDQTLAACATSTTMAATTPPVGTGTWTCISGCAGVTITSPNSPTSTVTGLTIGTNTVLRWTTSNAGCSSVSDDVTINTTMGPGCLVYCASNWTDPDDEYISLVTFGSINQAIGVGSYSSHLGSCATFTQGTSGNLCVSMIMNGAWNNNVHAFFDWDQNGTFETDVDLGNQVDDGTLCTNVTVPCSAVPGTVRMRIIIAEGATEPNGCSSGTFGDAADFCITVVAATPPVANAGTDQNVNCSSSTSLDASASTPAPANGYWTLMSGTGDLTNSTSPTSGITGLSNGANVFQWTEVGTCVNSTDEVTINVAGLPDEPVSAGDDVFSCTQGLALDGSDPFPFTGTWVVTSGPNSPTFTPNVNDPNAQVSGLINGTYVLEWQVNAGACGIISDQMTFNFGSLPAPNAGTDITTCPTGTTLNGNDFSGATGTWTVFSGPGGSGFVDDNDPNTMIYGLVPGSYVLHWSVSGGGCPGGTFDAVTITVNACTTAVTHSATSDQSFTGCQYTYTDNGGAGGNYSNSIAQTWTTFCPDDPNDFATLTFSAANFTLGDYITIYDDNGPAAPIIASYWYDPSPGGGMVYNPPLGTTITSSTGCLYVQMNSTATINSTGFAATVGCSSTAGTQSQQFVTVNNCGGGGGITLCGSGSIPAIAGEETNPPDLGGANSGCLGSQEGASNTWVYMTAETDGYIAFEISPAGGQDFDYAIWGPYDGGFACPGTTLDDPIRCSWAANGGLGCPAQIGLGILNSTGGPVLPGDVSETGTCTPTNEGWTYPILANAGEVYVLLFQNYSFNSSTFDVAINSDPTAIPPGGSYAALGCTPPQPLPIELLSFVGEHKNRVNKLYWNCASENNNDYFTIERSSDGKNWTVLTTVDGAGYSQSLTHYSTIDPMPLMGINYYRLMQTDFDGTKRKYKTISISTEVEIENLFSDVYPNPTDNSFYFNYGGKDFKSMIEVSVYNTAGQLMISNSFDTFNSTQSIEIETSELPTGIYYVSIKQNDKIEMKKVSIIK